MIDNFGADIYFIFDSVILIIIYRNVLMFFLIYLKDKLDRLQITKNLHMDYEC